MSKRDAPAGVTRSIEDALALLDANVEDLRTIEKEQRLVELMAALEVAEGARITTDSFVQDFLVASVISRSHRGPVTHPTSVTDPLLRIAQSSGAIDPVLHMALVSGELLEEIPTVAAEDAEAWRQAISAALSRCAGVLQDEVGQVGQALSRLAVLVRVLRAARP